MYEVVLVQQMFLFQCSSLIFLVLSVFFDSPCDFLAFPGSLCHLTLILHYWNIQWNVFSVPDLNKSNSFLFSLKNSFESPKNLNQEVVSFLVHHLSLSMFESFHSLQRQNPDNITPFLTIIRMVFFPFKPDGIGSNRALWHIVFRKTETPIN